MGKTYTQMWTLELTGSDQKRQNFDPPKKSSNGSSSIGKTANWKDNCCWKYNKGDTCPYGRNCRFDHRCTFCGSYSHPSTSCPRKQGGGSSRRQSNEYRNSNGTSASPSNSNNNNNRGHDKKSKKKSQDN